MDKQQLQRGVGRCKWFNSNKTMIFTLVGQHPVEHLGLLAGKLAAARKQQLPLLG